ncbi:MAG: hypothetical protein NW220_07605 [Leptolyngbyaceae cyanobacterium bins.349]|nr:hypothetical protein [Leptolyngbyaceae cyanobacterium bins.349]
MDSDYYGIKISVIPLRDRWRWQVVLVGISVTSEVAYDTQEQALQEGQRWISAETAFRALNNYLSELSGKGAIHRREYCDLLQSLVQITQHQ